MTLYTYVPSKDELLDLMVDQVLGERELPGPGEPRPTDWRDQIELYSEQTRAMFQRHPWLARSPRSAHQSDRACWRPASTSCPRCAVLGLGRTRRPTRLRSQSRRTSTRRPASRRRAQQLERATGQSHDAWWYERNDLWETYFDVDRHPAMTAIWNADGYGDAPAKPPTSPTASASTASSTASRR